VGESGYRFKKTLAFRLGISWSESKWWWGRCVANGAVADKALDVAVLKLICCNSISLEMHSRWLPHEAG
jgi:hypothetical protein